MAIWSAYCQLCFSDIKDARLAWDPRVQAYLCIDCMLLRDRDDEEDVSPGITPDTEEK